MITIIEISLKVNGETFTVECDPAAPLLYVLRNQLNTQKAVLVSAPAIRKQENDVMIKPITIGIRGLIQSLIRPVKGNTNASKSPAGISKNPALVGV